MKIDGRCHCGAITYQAEVNPDRVVVCHCTDCQSLSGSAFRVAVPSEGDTFKFLTGRPKVYVKTTAESGSSRDQAFCPECGTPIYSSGVGGVPPMHIRVGTIRQRDELAPKRQIWFRSAQHWLAGLASLTKSDKA
ncbi:MAG TPA: GFA family protein [Dongiaceae bacterium]|jgi:hypothetical protein|nr:GFA family protein [Dongiaceae bacterium]